MPEQFDPRSESLNTALPLMATPTTDPIVAGGPSSSENLNALREAMLADIAELDRRTADTRERISEAQTVVATQAAALASRFNSLSARLPTASGRWLIDFYTSTFVDPSSTAAIDTTYGQATLPILARQEKLVGEDSRGRVWIPKGAQLAYSYTGAAPQEVDWLTDDNSLHALDGRADTAWWRTRASSGTVWVRVRLPANLNSNKLANTIVLHPYPALSFDLVSAEWKNPGGVWTTADQSYLTGYNSGNSRVEWFGNVRLFIPQSQVTELRLKLLVTGLWGFNRISVQQIDFAPTATLVADFLPYNTGTIGSLAVFGKDQGRLSYLTRSINGTLASVELTQDTSNNSPIVTGIEARP